MLYWEEDLKLAIESINLFWNCLGNKSSNKSGYFLISLHKVRIVLKTSGVAPFQPLDRITISTSVSLFRPGTSVPNPASHHNCVTLNVNIKHISCSFCLSITHTHTQVYTPFCDCLSQSAGHALHHSARLWCQNHLRDKEGPLPPAGDTSSIRSLFYFVFFRIL